ncbi:CBS domain-containing protein [Nocardioides sp. J2M5]|uniref:CBS domain-containing protein n=1 Tax=Nocardioides palaemonis TaxID=2829810 RepID=UPI001BA91DB4|nr:CBS domain-containing protein [Nocardioides palaemonis]MBS2938382.1 CBS domain-containing protein [Nocardioides palaemonis]
MIELGSATVRSTVVTCPRTWGDGTTVGQARAAFRDDHLHMLLLTAGDLLLGTVVRADLVGASADDLVTSRAVLDGRTVAQEAVAEDVRRSMVRRGQRRVAVVDDAGRLIGLLCLKRHGGGFCRDEDVAARRQDRLTADVA